MKNRKSSFKKNLSALLIFMFIFLTFSITVLADGNKHVLAVNGRNLGKKQFDELSSLMQNCKIPKYKNNSKLYKYTYNTDSGLWDQKKKKETIKNIYHMMDRSFSKNSETDISFFYYSGHGEKPSEKNYSYSSIPIGHFGMFLSDNKNTMERISFIDLVKQLATYKGKMIVIMDCCYSGCIVDAAKLCLSSKDLSRFMFVCAGRNNEEVTTGHFSKRIVDILKNVSDCKKLDVNKDGYISGPELINDIKIYGIYPTHPIVYYTNKHYKTFPIFSYKNTKINLLLNKKSLSIYVGKKEVLKVVSGRKKEIQWKSRNTSIATVNSNGTVTGKRAGSVIITAKVGGQTAMCTVNVKNSNKHSSSKKNIKLTKKTQHKLYEHTIRSYSKSMKNGAKKWNEDIGLNTYFAFVDIDKNGIDELIVRAESSYNRHTTISTNGYGDNTHIYTIKNNKVKKILGDQNFAPKIQHNFYVHVYKNCPYINRGFSHYPYEYIFYKYKNGILSLKPTYRLAVGEWNRGPWIIEAKNVSQNYFMKQLKKLYGKGEGYPMHKYSASSYNSYI